MFVGEKGLNAREKDSKKIYPPYFRHMTIVKISSRPETYSSDYGQCFIPNLGIIFRHRDILHKIIIIYA